MRRSILALRGKMAATNPRTPRLIAYSTRRVCRRHCIPLRKIDSGASAGIDRGSASTLARVGAPRFSASSAPTPQHGVQHARTNRARHCDRLGQLRICNPWHGLSGAEPYVGRPARTMSLGIAQWQESGAVWFDWQCAVQSTRLPFPSAGISSEQYRIPAAILIQTR